MNIIKIQNVGKINSFNNRLDIKSNVVFNSTKDKLMVVLSDDDVNNENCLIKLRGYVVNILLIPKKYKYTFNNTLTGQMIIPNLITGCIISYY